MGETFVQSTYDVVDFLREQHGQIKDAFDDVLSASTTDERQRAFADLRQLLAAHEAAEETVVRGTVVGADVGEERGVTREMLRLEALDVGSAEFITALDDLRRAVMEHAAYEEAEEFPALQRKVPDDDLELMARAVQVAETIAGPDATSGVNPVAGPFAAMLDRARDLIAANCLRSRVQG